MTNRILTTALAVAAAVVIAGCGGGDNREAGPSEGTVVKEEMTTEERIEKIQNDPNIPAEYKQTYINSELAKAQKGSDK